jgi:two-component system sensor histidine kinase RegB
MYLLPLTIAAVALPWRHTWLIAGLAVICYTALMFWYQPLPMMQMDMSGMSGDDMHTMHMQHQHESGFTIHLLGMWAGFVVSAIVVAFFVERIGRNLREYDSLIAETREKALESERMLALGALATGAAHELGTPLATIAVLSMELAEEYADHAELAAQLGVMRQQVNRCKEIISSITASAGEARAEDGRPMALDQFLEQTVMRWRDMRPSVLLQCSMHGSTPAPIIAADRTLGQALVNLLNNAADASPEKVEMEIGWTDTELHLQIRDYGPGLAPEMEPRVGTPFFTTKKNSGGLGLGIFLSKTIIERLGGALRLGNRLEGGALTEVSLPLVKLLLRKS